MSILNGRSRERAREGTKFSRGGRATCEGARRSSLSSLCSHQSAKIFQKLLGLQLPKFEWLAGSAAELTLLLVRSWVVWLDISLLAELCNGGNRAGWNLLSRVPAEFFLLSIFRRKEAFVRSTENFWCIWAQRSVVLIYHFTLCFRNFEEFVFKKII